MIRTDSVNRVLLISVNNSPLSLRGHSRHRLIQLQGVGHTPSATITVGSSSALPFCHPQSCEVHLERQVTKTRADPGQGAPSPFGGPCHSKLQAEAQWPYLSEGFLANAPEMS
ncbi:unnamed protein product [Rangifer tarandus platyrhynchus]|uniref:Uncharacterized protein n=2 Tax=Rangifer tarandus platyrhynchus TaxID=3082113 RepID=A0ABN8YCI3_RANTA|nr:unnamed protein product [Rangifer tarandus platyrhynchus]